MSFMRKIRKKWQEAKAWDIGSDDEIFCRGEYTEMWHGDGLCEAALLPLGLALRNSKCSWQTPLMDYCFKHSLLKIVNMQYLLLPDVNICQFFYFSSKHKLIIYLQLFFSAPWLFLKFEYTSAWTNNYLYEYYFVFDCFDNRGFDYLKNSWFCGNVLRCGGISNLANWPNHLEYTTFYILCLSVYIWCFYIF